MTSAIRIAFEIYAYQQREISRIIQSCFTLFDIRSAKKRNHLKNYDFDISIDFDTIKQKMPLCNFCDRMIFLSLCICDKF